MEEFCRHEMALHTEIEAVIELPVKRPLKPVPTPKLYVIDLTLTSHRGFAFCISPKNANILVLGDKPVIRKYRSILLTQKRIRGLLLKTSVPVLLEQAVQDVASGKFFYDPQIDDSAPDPRDRDQPSRVPRRPLPTLGGGEVLLPLPREDADSNT